MILTASQTSPKELAIGIFLSRCFHGNFRFICYTWTKWIRPVLRLLPLAKTLITPPPRRVQKFFTPCSNLSSPRLNVWVWGNDNRIFFVNKRHVGAKSAPLRFKAVPFGAALKLRSAPLLLLSNSNPLRWVAVWFLVQTWRRYLFELAMVFSYPIVIGLFLIRGTIAKLLISLRLLKKCFGHSVIVWIPGAEKDCVTLSDWSNLRKL